MPPPSEPTLEPGRVYRTSDLAAWGRNPSRLARRLVSEGVLVRLAQGLFMHPRQSRFGPVPPDDDALMRSFLGGARFLVTGPERWNPLGLGSTAVFPAQLVYNTKRSGAFTLGGRRFILRRVGFPDQPTPEWAVVDLIEHHDMAGVSREELQANLARAIGSRRFRTEALRETARRYGTRATRDLIERAAKQAV